ncbi:MAG: hypothetical protein MNSN_09970 [Minisyncoccus archaeiphilus]|uniref:hypothetical protein n=1 Tax=Minisyncoccus archaeiphilus TaxID=3238481 RepID=UPI002B06F9E6|nr:MAG: hypothetical protein MNSN_09970 [Candidatus Parcubacteria bacterium]
MEDNKKERVDSVVDLGGKDINRRKLLGRVYNITLGLLIISYVLSLINNDIYYLGSSIPYLLAIILGLLIIRAKKPEVGLVMMSGVMAIIGFAMAGLYASWFNLDVRLNVLLLVTLCYVTVGLSSIIEAKEVVKTRKAGIAMIIIGLLLFFCAKLITFILSYIRFF